MPKVGTKVTLLSPYEAHGLDFTAVAGDEARADCPFCDHAGKLYVNVQTGLWQCHRCGEKGNPATFLQKLWEHSDTTTTVLEDLAAERGLTAATLQHWGVRRSLLTQEFLLPGYNAEWKLTQLYRYATVQGKLRLLATPGVSHGLFGVPLYDPHKSDVYLCEGPWDGMALWQRLRTLKPSAEGPKATGNPGASYWRKANVLAVPGCTAFRDVWAPLFADKQVFLLFDNDHARRLTLTTGQERLLAAAGTAGMQRTTELLANAKVPPQKIHYLHWGPRGYDPQLPSGYDVRDALTKLCPLRPTPGAGLQFLLDRLQPVPQEWLAKKQPRPGARDMACQDCQQWSVLESAWQQALRWTAGLDLALSVMLAAITSTRSIGDQLWVQIIGPPACGKSTLCEALSVDRQHIKPVSTLRGFHSGYLSDKHGTEDHSLLAKLYDKTLITKDGDTLLQAPNLQQILSEARDLYDSTSRSDYRHGKGRDYEGLRMTWILCGTPSLRYLDTSELGERFLRCYIMQGIDEALEDEILLRVANRANTAMCLEANGKAESQYEPALARAMQLTGGYVRYLRLHAARLIAAVHSPDNSPALRRCVSLGKFVAFLRARPSPKQDEVAEREFAARLVSQMIRLARCLAVVLNRPSLDDEVMRRVRQVALDTAQGRTLVIVRHLYAAAEQGLEKPRLELLTGEDGDKLGALLKYLLRIGAVERFQRPILGPDGLPVRGMASTAKPRWRLSSVLYRLYEEILGQEG